MKLITANEPDILQEAIDPFVEELKHLTMDE
jgi:hypothetical protein